MSISVFSNKQFFATDMIKVLFVISDYENVSLNKAVLRLAEGINPSKFSAYVFCLNSRGDLKAIFQDSSRIKVANASGGWMRRLKDLASFIEAENIDIVHSQTLRSDYAVFLAKRILTSNKKFVHVAVRQNYFFLPSESRFYWIKNLFYFFSCLIADHNICAANHLANKITQRFRLDPKKVSVIPNGVILLSTKRRLSPSDKRLLGIRRGVVVITFIGQLIERKNVSMLIRALSLVKQDYVALIVGKGAEEPRLKQLVSKHKLKNKIKFLGFKSDVTPYLSATDIFVMPSKGEGLSFALLEAMSYGIAGIVSDIQANCEAVTNNKQGLVFSLSKGEDDLAKKILRLIRDQSFRRRLGQAALAKIKRQHAKQKMIRQYELIYSQLLGRA